MNTTYLTSADEFKGFLVIWTTYAPYLGCWWEECVGSFNSDGAFQPLFCYSKLINTHYNADDHEKIRELFFKMAKDELESDDELEMYKLPLTQIDTDHLNNRLSWDILEEISKVQVDPDNGIEPVLEIKCEKCGEKGFEVELMSTGYKGNGGVGTTSTGSVCSECYETHLCRECNSYSDEDLMNGMCEDCYKKHFINLIQNEELILLAVDKVHNKIIPVEEVWWDDVYDETSQYFVVQVSYRNPDTYEMEFPKFLIHSNWERDAIDWVDVYLDGKYFSVLDSVPLTEYIVVYY